MLSYLCIDQIYKLQILSFSKSLVTSDHHLEDSVICQSIYKRINRPHSLYDITHLLY